MNKIGWANHPTQMEIPTTTSVSAVRVVRSRYRSEAISGRTTARNLPIASYRARRLVPPLITNHVPLHHEWLATGHHYTKGRCNDRCPKTQSGPCSLDLEHDLRWRREGSFGEDVRVLCASPLCTFQKRRANPEPSRSQWTTNVQCANRTGI